MQVNWYHRFSVNDILWNIFKGIKIWNNKMLSKRWPNFLSLYFRSAFIARFVICHVLNVWSVVAHYPLTQTHITMKLKLDSVMNDYGQWLFLIFNIRLLSRPSGVLQKIFQRMCKVIICLILCELYVFVPPAPQTSFSQSQETQFCIEKHNTVKTFDLFDPQNRWAGVILLIIRDVMWHANIK